MPAGPERVTHLELLALLRELATGRMPALVGVDGCGGSGKSTLASSLARVAPAEVAVVEADDFYLPSAERDGRAGSGAAYDWARLREEALLPLADGRPALYRRYDWVADRIGEEECVVEPAPLVLIEGVYCTGPGLADHLDLALWVECPRELRLERGLLRDGPQSLPNWVDVWMPAEDEYVAAHDPAGRAHLVVDNGVPRSDGEVVIVRGERP